MHPRVGHPPSLWKVWALVREHSSAAAATMVDVVLQNMVSDRRKKCDEQKRFLYPPGVQLTWSPL